MSPKKQKKYYHISNVARMYDIHPQTLRLYEREGLLTPSRSEGNTRLYSEEDLQQLEVILSLTRDPGSILCKACALISTGTSITARATRIRIK